MTDLAQAAALTAAIQALTNAVGTIVAPAAPAAHVPIRDIFASTNAFDVSTKAGMEALSSISKPLTEPWDGSTAIFPEFLVNLQLRANKGKDFM